MHDLAYGDNTNHKMNDPSLEMDRITPMNRRNLDNFCSFTCTTLPKQGVFPPILIVHDENCGCSVKALKCMQQHKTYRSISRRSRNNGAKRSVEQRDSLMVLLDTDDPRTSFLIIDPSRVGNFERYLLSGSNNRSVTSKRKINNVRTT